MPDNSVSTCFWFHDTAEDAANFYVSLLPDSRIERIVSGPDGKVMLVLFTLSGIPYQALNGCPEVKFTEAASISVLTSNQAETDRLWSALTADGGSEGRCGWLTDRFGLTWQVLPRRAAELLGGADAAKVFPEMMKMARIDLERLEAAAAA